MKKICWALDRLEEYDEICKPTAARLHFNKDLKSRTLVGGFFTVLIRVYVYNIGI